MTPARPPSSAAAALASGALCLVLIAPPAGRAHVRVVPDRLESASRAILTVIAPTEHEDSQPMVGLKLSLPEGMTIIDGTTTGWTLDLEPGVAKWSEGAAESSTTPQFRLQAVAPPRAGEYELRAAQLYADGHSDRWTVPVSVFEPPPGQNLAAAAIVAILGVGLTTAIVLLRGRRHRSPGPH